MKTLRSYLNGAWYEATTDFTTLFDPSTEEPVARASSAGADLGAALAYAREQGGPALRALSFAQRGDLLRGLSKALRDHRDELLELSAQETGTTRADGSFDIDGAAGTLAYYGGLARGMGERPLLVDGEGVQMAKTDAFYGRHALVPRPGVAVHVNAFNFPVWGFAEKAACALLAGMPVITKPATATAGVSERAIEILVDSKLLPTGALQLICGGTGDLLDRLGAQDVFAFTGSADTALALRGRRNLLAASTRINVEADSLNAAVLAPGVGEGPLWELFLRDVVREMTQKSGQKCTAVRRILVPAERFDAVREALCARLAAVVTGNPSDAATTMGPLATATQLAAATAGVASLLGSARLLHGTGKRVDGHGSAAGKGYFFAPTLLGADDALGAGAVHDIEVFAPVATLLPYDGNAGAAASIVALGGGTLVTSAYSDNPAWCAEFLARAGAATGRIYFGSSASAAEAPGSGIAMPHCLHGGPGRAGGGAELGGLRGLEPYLQRVAVQGSKSLVDGLVVGAG
jgi:3,4-dehydroadipyl-CoA semialdehyde dehydrogenase